MDGRTELFPIQRNLGPVRPAVRRPFTALKAARMALTAKQSDCPQCDAEIRITRMVAAAPAGRRPRHRCGLYSQRVSIGLPCHTRSGTAGMMHQLFMTAAADQPMDWGAYGRLLPHTWRFSHAKIVTPCTSRTYHISDLQLRLPRFEIKHVVRLAGRKAVNGCKKNWIQDL